MNRNQFLKALTARFYPILRAEGFRGSGNNLRRINGEVVHIFNVWGQSDGRSCHLNFGAHLLFLPDTCGRLLDATTFSEPQCAFRGSFDPPFGPPWGWFYGQSEEEMNESIAFICDHWHIYGHEFFNRYKEYPKSFASLIEKVDAAATHPIDLLNYARIAKQMGDIDRCVVFATEGLNKCRDGGIGIRASLDEFMRSVEKG